MTPAYFLSLYQNLFSTISYHLLTLKVSHTLRTSLSSVSIMTDTNGPRSGASCVINNSVLYIISAGCKSVSSAFKLHVRCFLNSFQMIWRHVRKFLLWHWTLCLNAQSFVNGMFFLNTHSVTHCESFFFFKRFCTVKCALMPLNCIAEHLVMDDLLSKHNKQSTSKALFCHKTLKFCGIALGRGTTSTTLQQLQT